MGGAVPVFGPSGQVRAADGFPGPGAFDRGGINTADVVAFPESGDEPVHAFTEPAQAQGALGLARQIGEHAPVVFLRVPQPSGPRREPEQGLQQRQGHHLGIGDSGADPDPGRGGPRCNNDLGGFPRIGRAARRCGLRPVHPRVDQYTSGTKERGSVPQLRVELGPEPWNVTLCEALYTAYLIDYPA